MLRTETVSFGRIVRTHCTKNLASAALVRHRQFCHVAVSCQVAVSCADNRPSRLAANRPPSRPARCEALVLALGLILLASGGTAAAQPAVFPVKPVRIIIPFAPGGHSDIISRTVSQKMSEQWGQPVVYDNRGGAGGTLGIEAVVRAPADGYTIGAGSQSALSIAQHLYARLPYDPLKEIQGVVTLVLTPYVVALNSRVPAKSMADLVKIAKSKPLRLSFGSSGAGSISHIAAASMRPRWWR